MPDGPTNFLGSEPTSSVPQEQYALKLIASHGITLNRGKHHTTNHQWLHGSTHGSFVILATACTSLGTACKNESIP